MNPYSQFDQRMKALVRQITAEFQNAANAIPFDHLNLAGARRVARLAFRRSRSRCLALYAAIYAELDPKPDAEARQAAVKAVLRSYHPVTGYVYESEADRRTERLIESVMAAQNRRTMREAYARAARLFAAQAEQYADLVVDAALLAALRDRGVKWVRWVSQKDDRRCPDCRALDGKVFSLDKIPPKPHPRCRCYVIEA